jgi:hypothetical protein
MEHGIAARHGVLQTLRIHYIGADQAKISGAVRVLEVPLQSLGKIVVPDHLVTQGQKTVHEIAANKSGRAGYKCS